jgi:hypothetical protein
MTRFLSVALVVIDAKFLAVIMTRAFPIIECRFSARKLKVVNILMRDEIILLN